MPSAPLVFRASQWRPPPAATSPSPAFHRPTRRLHAPGPHPRGSEPSAIASGSLSPSRTRLASRSRPFDALRDATWRGRMPTDVLWITPAHHTCRYTPFLSPRAGGSLPSPRAVAPPSYEPGGGEGAVAPPKGGRRTWPSLSQRDRGGG
eukprot:scaffold738_cov340-Pavlova_lutheri.AAC.9